MGLTDMIQDLWGTQPFWSSSWKTNVISSGMTRRLCHRRAMCEQLHQPQHRYGPWSREDQMWVVRFMNPNAAETVCVHGSLQRSQIGCGIGVAGTISGYVYAASGGWVSTWPAGLHIAGASSLRSAGSCTEACLAQQCVRGSVAEGSVVCNVRHMGTTERRWSTCSVSSCFQHGVARAARNTLASATWKSRSLAFSSLGSISQLTRTFSLVFLLATGRFGSAGFVGGDVFESNPQSLCAGVGFLRSLVSHCSNKRSTEAWTQAALWSCYFWSRCSLGFWADESPFVPGTALVDGTESLIRRVIASLGIFNTGSFKQTHIHMAGCEGLSD